MLQRQLEADCRIFVWSSSLTILSHWDRAKVGKTPPWSLRHIAMATQRVSPGLEVQCPLYTPPHT